MGESYGERCNQGGLGSPQVPDTSSANATGILSVSFAITPVHPQAQRGGAEGTAAFICALAAPKGG